MTNKTAAQEALEGIEDVECEDTALDWFKEYANQVAFDKNIVKKSLKLFDFIERHKTAFVWQPKETLPYDTFVIFKDESESTFRDFWYDSDEYEQPFTHWKLELTPEQQAEFEELLR